MGFLRGAERRGASGAFAATRIRLTDQAEIGL